MTVEQSATATTADRVEIERRLLSYLQTRLKTTVTPKQDLFTDGPVTSIMAMELVVHLEQGFNVTIADSDLQLQNFRSVDDMTALVLRLQSDNGH